MLVQGPKRRAGPGSEGSAGIGTKEECWSRVRRGMLVQGPKRSAGPGSEEERWSRVRRGVLVQGPKRSVGFYFVNMNDG